MDNKRDIINCGPQFLGLGSNANDGPPKKKKLSLFAQKMLKQKQEATAQSSGATPATTAPLNQNEDGFPSVPKLFNNHQEVIEQQKQQKQAENNQPPLVSETKKMTNLISNLPNVANDEQIHHENVQKLMEMTPAQIKEEQESLKALFSKEQIEMLKKLGQRGKPRPKRSAEATGGSEQEEVRKPKVLSTSQSKYAQGGGGMHPLKHELIKKSGGISELQHKLVQQRQKPLTSEEDFSAAVKKQHDIDTEIDSKIDLWRVTEGGEMSFTAAPKPGEMDEESTEINYAESLDLDEFMNIQDKLFSLREILALLQSTYPQHKIFALRIINNSLKPVVVAADADDDQEANSKRDFIFHQILDPQRTSLLQTIMSCGQITRLDFINILIEVTFNIYSYVFGKVADTVHDQALFHLQHYVNGNVNGPFPWQFWLTDHPIPQQLDNLKSELLTTENTQTVNIICQKLFTQPPSSPNLLLYAQAFKLLRLMTQVTARENQTFSIFFFKWLKNSHFLSELKNVEINSEEAQKARSRMMAEFFAIVEGLMVRGCTSQETARVQIEELFQWSVIIENHAIVGQLHQEQISSFVLTAFLTNTLSESSQGYEELLNFIKQYLTDDSYSHTMRTLSYIPQIDLFIKQCGQTIHQVNFDVALQMGPLADSTPSILKLLSQSERETLRDQNENLSLDTLLQLPVTPHLIRICQLLMQYDPQMIQYITTQTLQELQTLQECRPTDISSRQVYLSYFTAVKAYLHESLTKVTPTAQTLITLTKLVNVNDQALWEDLMTNWLFKDEGGQAFGVPSGQWAILREFKFSVIPNEEATQQPQQHFHMIELYPQKEEQNLLPLLPDWFFRPMFYINSPEDKLQGLIQVMFQYLIGLQREESELLPLFGVYGLQGIQILTYMANEIQKEPNKFIQESKSKESHPPIILNHDSQRLLDELQQSLIESMFGDPKPSQLSITSQWLARTYANIFQLPSFYEQLSTFFNSYPPEMSPTLFKTLLFAIAYESPSNQQASSDLDMTSSTSEPKREFMNGMTDILPCIIRWEIDDLPDKSGPFFTSLQNQIGKNQKASKNDPSRFYEIAYERVVTWLQQNLGIPQTQLDKSIILQSMKSLI